MPKLKTFLIGLMLGFGAGYTLLEFHFVHSHDGIYLVPRATRHDLSLAYVDTRNWNASDWAGFPQIRVALDDDASVVDSVEAEFEDSSIERPDADIGTLPGGFIRPLALTGEEVSAFETFDADEADTTLKAFRRHRAFSGPADAVLSEAAAFSETPRDLLSDADSEELLLIEAF